MGIREFGVTQIRGQVFDFEFWSEFGVRSLILNSGVKNRRPDPNHRDSLVSDWSNYGQWQPDSNTICERGIWGKILQDFDTPAIDPARAEALQEFIDRRTAEGCA